MARSAKPNPPENSGLTPWRVGLHSLAAVVLIATFVVGVYFLKKKYLERTVLPPQVPQVVLKHKPVWMSDILADQIVAVARPDGAYSPFDRQPLLSAAGRLRLNPWVKKVNQVRRVYGQSAGDTLEVDCEYRAPIAMVRVKPDATHQGDELYWLVDGDGVKLPEFYSAADVGKIMYGLNGKVNIRIIEDVESWPPETGQVWTGADLAAGLDMAKLLYGKGFAEEIVKINVGNFAGRRDQRQPQIRLVTSHNPPTQVLWGEPVRCDFRVELPPADKLDRLATVRREKGRVDAGHSWLDIRFDRITYPGEESPDLQAAGQ